MIGADNSGQFGGFLKVDSEEISISFCILQSFSTGSLRLVNGTTDCEFAVSGGSFDGKWNDRNRAEFT